MSQAFEPIPRWNGGAASTPLLRVGFDFFAPAWAEGPPPWFSRGGDTKRLAPGMPVCAAGALHRNTGADPGRRTRLPGGTTWIESLPTRVRLFPRLATTTIS